MTGIDQNMEDNSKSEESKKDNAELEFEKFKFKVGIVKWFIGSVTLVVISMIIEWGFKDRAAGINEIKEYDKYATELIILNNDPVKKRMLAQYFSMVTPSEKLREGWEAYYKVVDKEYREFIKQDSMAQIRLAELQQDTLGMKNVLAERELELISGQLLENQRIKNQPIVLPDKQSVQPILYIQIGDNSNRSKANALRSKISGIGIQAPGIELVESAKNLASNEIRYYWENDAIFANSLQILLDGEGIQSNIKFIPTYKSKTKEGTLELWLK